MIFFVLSGYFISHSVIKSMKQGIWSWSDYLIRRIIRLWIVLLPALSLTYVWAKIQTHLFGSATIFKGVLDFKTLIGNILFLQDIKVKQFGLNGPLWSLTYEFWYYILFPCALLVIFSKTKLVKMFYALLFVCISLFLGKQIMLYFLIWLLGTLVAIIQPRKFKSSAINYFVLVFLVLLVTASTKGLYTLYSEPMSWVHPFFFPDLSVGFAFSLLMYWIISIFNDVKINSKLSVLRTLAGFSYTLYLVHYPLMYFWSAWTASAFWEFNSQQTHIAEILYLLCVLVYAYTIAYLTEFKTRKLTGKVFNFIPFINRQEYLGYEKK